jgi:hypothetical protein
MEHTYRRALVAGAAALLTGGVHATYLVVTGRCADLVVHGTPACGTAGALRAGLVVFTVSTLALTLLVALLALRGGLPRAGLGDTFVALGSMVAMVQAAVVSVTGAPIGVAHGLAVFALTLVAVRRASSPQRHDREVATVLTMALTMGAVLWASFQPQDVLLGMPVTVLWALGALSYLEGARTVAPRPVLVRTDAG